MFSTGSQNAVPSAIPLEQILHSASHQKIQCHTHRRTCCAVFCLHLLVGLGTLCVTINTGSKDSVGVILVPNLPKRNGSAANSKDQQMFEESRTMVIVLVVDLRRWRQCLSSTRGLSHNPRVDALTRFDQRVWSILHYNPRLALSYYIFVCCVVMPSFFDKCHRISTRHFPLHPFHHSYFGSPRHSKAAHDMFHDLVSLRFVGETQRALVFERFLRDDDLATTPFDCVST